MKRNTKGLISIPTTHHASHDPALQRRIQERAYQLFEMRGGGHGHPVEDWLRAEREVTAAWKRQQTGARPKSAPTGRSRTRTPKAA